MRLGRELLERPRRYFSYLLLLVLPIVLVVAIIRVMGRADGAMQDPVEPLWLSREEVAQLPASGPAWTLLKVAADTDLRVARIADQDSEHDTNTLAAALVYTRTHDDAYRAKVAGAIEAAIGTQKGGRVLALARNLPAYPIAADLIDLATYDPSPDTRFRAWLTDVRHVELKGVR